MLSLLGLISALFAGVMGDTFMGRAPAKDDNADDDAVPDDTPPTGFFPPGTFGEDIPPETELPPEPADENTDPVLFPEEELPGEEPDGGTAPEDNSLPLFGTEGDDLLEAGAENDVLMGLGGSDSIHGGAGSDLIFGSDDDTADFLFGGEGDDSFRLGAGDDASGGDGSDTFTLADYGPDAPPALITDYEKGEDHIVVLYDSDLHPNPQFETAAIDGTDDIAVLLDGVQVAIVQGGNGLTLDDIMHFAA